MPVYQVDLQFYQATEYWTNKWYIIAADLPGVTEWVNYVAGLFQGSVGTQVTIDKARVTPLPFVKNVFRDIPLGLVGTAPFASPAPLFNVARWRMGKGYGRQVNHYIRGTFPPAAIGSNGAFAPGALADQQNIVNLFMDAAQIVCDKNGNQYTFASVAPNIGMRQLRRGSKRKAKPVI